jgi:integrase
MNKLDTLFSGANSQENTYKILKIIYILAYRTGMRINEILGLRVRDIEGLSCLSVWIQPYGSKKKGNLHQLKTDSAERKVPVYCLLKTDEYQIFHNHVVEQRLLNQENLYLFRNWNENSKLNKHTVTTPFRMIMNELLKLMIILFTHFDTRLPITYPFCSTAITLPSQESDGLY